MAAGMPPAPADSGSEFGRNHAGSGSCRGNSDRLGAQLVHPGMRPGKAAAGRFGPLRPLCGDPEN